MDWRWIELLHAAGLFLNGTSIQRMVIVDKVIGKRKKKFILADVGGAYLEQGGLLNHGLNILARGVEDFKIGVEDL